MSDRLPRRSRAFWVIPAQPVQELYGAQAGAADPVAATVLMALIAGMSMNDGFGGVPAYHVSISQRELAERTGGLLSRKAVCNALNRLEKRGHLTPIKGPSDGTRRGPNARITYRVDLLADETTAFHSRGPSTEPSTGPGTKKKGPSYIQKEFSEGEQTTTTPADRDRRVPAEQIAEARQRYAPDQLEVIDAAVADFARTRKGGKIADSVVLGEYEWWARWPAEQVAAGLRQYVSKRYALDGKPENYARGIIRNTKVASPGVDSGSNGRGGAPDACAPFRDEWKAKIGEPPETLDAAVEAVRSANPDDWEAGLVLQSFRNYLEEKDPEFARPKDWKDKWRAYTNDGEVYQRRIPAEAREVLG